MLTASSPMPKHAPRPQNWQGVKAGLAACARLLQQGDLYSAEIASRQVLEFAPMEGKAWHLLGRILQKANRHSEALECFTSAENAYARHHHTQESPASIRLARLLRDQGEHEQAHAVLSLLLMRNPNDHILQQLRQTWSEEDGQSI